MVYANYHTHTARCRHASGTEREYIETAIKAGIKILGFSDHSPYIFKDTDYYSNYRMFPEETEDYVRTLQDLRDEYRDDIEIHIGIEIEYYQKYFDETIRFLSQFPLEYYILGQHNLGNEVGHPFPWPGLASTDLNAFDTYINEVEQGLNSFNFICLAHPDLFHYTGPDSEYLPRAEKICELALKHDVPLELNLLGLRSGRNYPDERFWKLAAEKGNRVVIGVDAHDAPSLAHEESYAKALAICAKYGIVPEKTLNFSASTAKNNKLFLKN